PGTVGERCLGNCLRNHKQACSSTRPASRSIRRFRLARAEARILTTSCQSCLSADKPSLPSLSFVHAPYTSSSPSFTWACPLLSHTWRLLSPLLGRGVHGFCKHPSALLEERHVPDPSSHDRRSIVLA